MKKTFYYFTNRKIMDIKESSIAFDETFWMYKIDLWFYTRYFETFIFSHNGIYRIFWDKSFFPINFSLNDDVIFWVSSFLNFKIFNILNLDTFEDIYRIVKDFKLFSFEIKDKKYYLLTFLDWKNNFWYYTNFQDKNFDIIFWENSVYIKNNIFDTVIFSFECDFKITENINGNFQKLDFSLIDFFYFQNPFSSFQNHSLKEDFLVLDIEGIKFSYEFDVIKFEIYKIEQNFLKEIRKLFLTLNHTQLFCYLPENKKIKNMFLYFYDVSKLDIKELDFNFVKPENIFEYDERFLFFAKNFYLLEYILYVMKINYKNIWENHIFKKQNEYEKLAFLRQDITKESLEKNILYFEEKFEVIKKNILFYLDINYERVTQK